MHLGYLAYTHYMVEIRFYGLERHTFNVKEITFYVSHTVNFYYREM